LTRRFARFNDVLVAPGHHDPAGGDPDPVLWTVRRRLPAFSTSTEAFVDGVVGALGDRPASHERIVALELGRETADDETAFELELGPNNCAVAASAGADPGSTRS